MKSINKKIVKVLRYSNINNSCNLDYKFLFEKTNIIYKKITKIAYFKNVDNLIIYHVCCLLILKFINDININNNDWARIFKINLLTFNFLEVKILIYLDFNLYKIIKKEKSLIKKFLVNFI